MQECRTLLLCYGAGGENERARFTTRGGAGDGVCGLGQLVVAQAPLPKDIDPQSLSRLPNVQRDSLDDDGKRIYDMLAGGEGKTVGADRSGGDFAPEPQGGRSHPDAESVPALSWRAETPGF